MWVTNASYGSRAHPQASNLPPIRGGANCQRYAYGVLGLFGRHLPPHRSSELWQDPHLTQDARPDAEDLDLAMFNAGDAARGAHLAVVIGHQLLHLCSEERLPALWSWQDFSARPRYAHLVGLVRS